MPQSISLKKIVLLLFITVFMTVSNKSFAQLQDMKVLNVPIDISDDFRDFSNTYYLADSLAKFDPATASGTIVYKRYQYFTRLAFNNMLGILKPVPPNEFPTTEYAASPELAFSLQFVSPRTVRIRASSGYQVNPDQ